MSEFSKLSCPRCGAGNRLGALVCAACGKTLLHAGLAARPVDDDEDDEPRRPLKRPVRPAEDAVQKGPPKKKTARPIDEDDEDDVPRSVKKRRREPEDEPENLRDNAVLNMFLPVGVSLWAMGANYLGLLSVLGVLFGAALASALNIKVLGLILPGLGALVGLLAILLGITSFFIRPKKTTYGSVTGYMRAVIGIILGFIGLVGGPVVIFLFSRM